MPSYEFTGDWPRVFGNLSHGVDGVTVRRTEAGVVDEHHTTVLLYPGDVLTADEPVIHGELRPVEDSAPTSAKPKAPRIPVQATAPEAETGD